MRKGQRLLKRWIPHEKAPHHGAFSLIARPRARVGVIDAREVTGYCLAVSSIPSHDLHESRDPVCSPCGVGLAAVHFCSTPTNEAQTDRV